MRTWETSNNKKVDFFFCILFSNSLLLFSLNLFPCQAISSTSVCLQRKEKGKKTCVSFFLLVLMRLLEREIWPLIIATFIRLLLSIREQWVWVTNYTSFPSLYYFFFKRNQDKTNPSTPLPSIKRKKQIIPVKITCLLCIGKFYNTPWLLHFIL